MAQINVIMFPQRVHVIKRNNNAIFGFQQSAFGFLNKGDAHYIMHVIKSQQTRLVYYPSVAPNKFKLHLGSGQMEPSLFLIAYNEIEYQTELLLKNMSIRVVESLEKTSGDGSISIISHVKIEPDLENDVGLLEILFMKK